MGFRFWGFFPLILCGFVVARFILCLLIHFYRVLDYPTFLCLHRCLIIVVNRQSSIVNSYVDEFAYVISFLGFAGCLQLLL